MILRTHSMEPVIRSVLGAHLPEAEYEFGITMQERFMPACKIVYRGLSTVVALPFGATQSYVHCAAHGACARLLEMLNEHVAKGSGDGHGR